MSGQQLTAQQLQAAAVAIYRAAEKYRLEGKYAMAEAAYDKAERVYLKAQGYTKVIKDRRGRGK